VSVAFVLGGGGGPLGAHEVGMLRALIERGIQPDLVLGTSVGAINGAAVAADPSVAGVERLTDMWSAIDRTDVLGGSVFGRLATLARTRTHLHDNQQLRALLTDGLASRFEDLAVQFQCVARANPTPRLASLRSGGIGKEEAFDLLGRADADDAPRLARRSVNT
jgi:NTE family protein